MEGKGPNEGSFFLCVKTATKGKFITMDNLGGCVWYISVAYVSGVLSGESVDQLLIHCPFAYDIWSMLFGILGLAWVML